GVLYTASGLRSESAATWSTIYGLAWWIGGWFAVMPPPGGGEGPGAVPARGRRTARVPGLRGGARGRLQRVRSRRRLDARCASPHRRAPDAAGGAARSDG